MIENWLPNTPRMVASLITCSSVISRVTGLPSTSVVSRLLFDEYDRHRPY